MISWKTTTMARVSTLEETLFSFLNQNDLSDTEMVIVNDYPHQTLIFKHPQVRIFNIKEPFKTIGEKENFAVEQCKGEIIAVTDDDDTYLSNHNSNIRKYFKEDTNILHWKGCFYNEPNITSIEFIGNSGMVYSRKAWEKVGKHPVWNAGGDTMFSNKVHKLGGMVIAEPPNSEVSAFYRWKLSYEGLNGEDVGIFHQSGEGTDTLDKPSIIQRHSLHIESLRLKGIIPTGEIKLKPRWVRPYDKMLQDFNNKEK